MTTPTAPRRSFTAQEREAFMNNLMDASMGLREKAAGSTPAGDFVHGPTGILSFPGQRQDVLNAMISPIGLQGLLERQYRVSAYANEVYPILTGQTASTGTEPTQACEDGTQPGNLKMCNTTFSFGRIVKDSQVLQADRPGLLVNRGEFRDQRLIGNPLTNISRPAEIDLSAALRNEGDKKLFELYNAYVRDYAHLLYDGNPANTVGSTGYIEYRGLDLIINTGYQDVVFGGACQAADSVLVSFGDSPVTGNENQIVTDIVETYAYLDYLAERTGLKPVEYVLSMRYSLYRLLSQIWPCVYMTYRCVIQSANSTNFVSAEMQVKMRDDMRNGIFDGRDVGMPYLLIDGKAIPVVIDDSIDETALGSNLFESQIYYVPLTVKGRPSTYLEYFDLNAPGGMADVVEQWAPNDFKILGDGRFWLHRKPPTNECLQIRLGTRPRLIMEAPFLAARLFNLRYSPPLFHERSPFPDDPYFVNGGNVAIGEPYFYPQTA